MACPHCGSAAPAVGGTCPLCHQGTTSSATLSATLTPPPAAGDELTRLPSVSSAPLAKGPLAAGDPLGPRYRILNTLGAGGMGVVYKAWDEELGVAVALKVIRPEITADPESAREVERRFKRELLLAREVSHRNVVRIHDLGDVNGMKYISMSFVDGRSLADLLHDRGKLPIAEALSIARHIAAGLAAAHEAGVVHRDLKPENVMVQADDGHAVIMDFGISRTMANSAAGATDDAIPSRGALLDRAALARGMTATGAVMGTVEYMAPEQARAEPVDQRADIYAFGLMLRDMMMGSTRTARTTPLDELAARMRQAPPSLHAIDAHIPAAVDEVIRRCVEPDPAARFQTTQDLLAALDCLDSEGQLLPEPIVRFGRRQLAAAALALVALVAGTWWLARPSAPPPPPPPMSVLIADFENTTGDAVFEGSLEQTLAIGMEGASFIGAYPRNDAAKLVQQLAPGQRLDLERARLVAGREGINVVVAGAIAPRGSGYQLTARLIDPVPGTELARIDQDAKGKDDILPALARVTSRVRSALGDTTPESARVADRETFTAASLQAARAYSRGQELQWAAKYEEAIPFYREATEADPNFGRAYANWAVSAFYLGRQEESERLYQQAFAHMDRMTDREKYRTYGSYYLTNARNYEKAIENYTKLVQLYPADRSGYGNLGVAYFYQLNFAKALEQGRLAMQLYPASLKLRNNVALYAMYAGDFTAAERAAAEVIKADPSYYRAYLPLAVGAAARGDLDAARTAYGEMAKAGKQGRSLAAMGLADLAMYEGRFEKAAEILRGGIAYDESIQNRAAQLSKQSALAEAYLEAGRKALAIDAAGAAVALDQGFGSAAAARVLVQAGRLSDASAIARRLDADLHPYSRTYAHVIDGDIARDERRLPRAADAYRAAQKTTDLWLTRYTLGIAYVEAGHFAEALAELEAAEKRRGEATALFLDDSPTVRYLAGLPYWLARAQESVRLTKPAIANYSWFLRLRDPATDPLARDATGRLQILSRSTPPR